MRTDVDLELERLAGEIFAAYNRATELRQKVAAELLLQALEELAGGASSCEDALLEAYAQAIPREQTGAGTDGACPPSRQTR